MSAVSVEYGQRTVGSALYDFIVATLVILGIEAMFDIPNYVFLAWVRNLPVLRCGNEHGRMQHFKVCACARVVGPHVFLIKSVVGVFIART